MAPYCSGAWVQSIDACRPSCGRSSARVGWLTTTPCRRLGPRSMTLSPPMSRLKSQARDQRARREPQATVSAIRAARPARSSAVPARRGRSIRPLKWQPKAMPPQAEGPAARRPARRRRSRARLRAGSDLGPGRDATTGRSGWNSCAPSGSCQRRQDAVAGIEGGGHEVPAPPAHRRRVRVRSPRHPARHRDADEGSRWIDLEPKAGLGRLAPGAKDAPGGPWWAWSARRSRRR